MGLFAFRQRSQPTDFRLCDQNRGPPHRRQFLGCRGRQLAHPQSGHRPHRQNGMRPSAVRITTLARHAGQSRRHGTVRAGGGFAR